MRCFTQWIGGRYPARCAGVFLLLSVRGTVSGDVRVNDRTIEIVGRISQADVARLNNAFQNPKIKAFNVFLDSDGGEILPALRMGRLLRSRTTFTFVVSPASCSSACVFLLAAGVSRAVWGEQHIGIHRPAFPPRLFADLSVEAASRLYNSLIEKCRAYLKEMGIADRLLDEMLKVPSGEIRWLSEDELVQFNLNGSDLAFAEWVRARGIKQFGLAEVERQERATRCIGETGDWRGCMKLHGSPFPPGTRLPLELSKVPTEGLPPGFEPIR